MQSRNGSDVVAKVKGTVKLHDIERPMPAGKRGASPVAAVGVKLPSAMDTQSSQQKATDSQTSRLLCFQHSRHGSELH